MTTREARRARAQRRHDLRVTLFYLVAVVIGVSAALAIDAWLRGPW